MKKFTSIVPQSGLSQQDLSNISGGYKIDITTKAKSECISSACISNINILHCTVATCVSGAKFN
jgi:hypothetical protein